MTDAATLLPPNAAAAERALSQATARIGDVAVPLRTLWHPQTCPVALLPWLAWAVGVDGWSSSWDEPTKRAAIAAAIDVRRHKGTLGAMQRALGAVGYSIAVREWFQDEPPAAPYTFALDVQVTGKGITAEVANNITAIAHATKNLRSRLSGLRLIGATSGQFTAAAHTYAGATHTVRPFQVAELSTTATPHAGATTQASAIISVHPAG